MNTITVFGSVDRSVLDDAEARVMELHRSLSVFDETSEISRINAAAGKSYVNVSDDTIELLKAAKRFSKMSGGAFSATMRPLTSLWKISTGAGEIPVKRKIEKAITLVDDEDILIDEENKAVMLRRRGQAIDLGGIAKGYAADEVKRILTEHGVKEAIINLGGTVTVMGKERPVGIQHPRKFTGVPMGKVMIKERSAVTSGDYERCFLKDGVRYHHILDPLTGFPADSGLCAVTVIGSDATELDAISTAIFVDGPAKGAKLVNELGIDAIMIDQAMNVYCSESLKNNFELIDQMGR